MPCSPVDPLPDSLVPLVVVLPVEVGRHAGVEPPAGAVVGATVSRWVHVVIAVKSGEELLVVVILFVEADGVPGSPAAKTNHRTDIDISDVVFKHDLLLQHIWQALLCANTQFDILPVSTDGQPVAQVFVGHVELVKLGILPDTLKVLQLDTQDHVFGLGQQMDMVIAQPELTSARQQIVENRGRWWNREKLIRGYKKACILVHLMRKWIRLLSERERTEKTLFVEWEVILHL